MLKSVEEIRGLRDEVRAEMGGSNIDEDAIGKWTSQHVGIDFDALQEYLDAGEYPNDPKAAFFAGAQIGAAARERL